MGATAGAGSGVLNGSSIAAADLYTLSSGFTVPNSCVLTCGYSSPGSGFGLSISNPDQTGTTLRSESGAFGGIGFDRSLPVTPSKLCPRHVTRCVEMAEQIVERSIFKH